VKKNIQPGPILNTEQKKAVRFGNGPLLIIAGAGTGKTTVITERIKHLIAVGKAKPEEILSLTFTEKASREMEDRVDRALPYGVNQMWISTFHSFCDKILKNEGLALGISPSYTLMTEAESIQFMRQHLFEFPLTYYRPLGNPGKFIEGMLQHFSRLKDEDTNPEQYTKWVSDQFEKLNSKLKDHAPIDESEKEELEKYRELAECYTVYENAKIKEGKFDFSDLIAKTVALFRLHPSILKKYQAQFRYILIDEFQDTNYSQNMLAMLLAGERKNITVVADDDQSIYKWRGAAISNVIEFRKRYKGTKIITLTKNYRSTKEILDRSYDLVTHNNPNRLEVIEHIDKKLECVRREHGKKIQVIAADRVEDEAQEVVNTIQKLHSVKAVTQTDDESSNDQKQFLWKNFAILVRANSHAEPFIRALSRAGIPYQFLGPGQLLRQPEVKDLIAYMTLLADISNSMAMYRLISMPIFNIPARDIALCMAYAKRQKISLFASVEWYVDASHADGEKLTADGQMQLSVIIQMLYKHLKLVREESAGQILYYFLKDTGLLTTVVTYNTTQGEIRAQNIAKFFDRLKTYEATHEDASVFSVVEWVAISMDLGESPLASNNDWSENDAVNIMTVHSSKGLEFPIVFIVNLVSQRFPSTEKHEPIPIPDALIKDTLPTGDFHEQEERRLFYVAMTRARDQLYLTTAKYYGEGKREKKPSIFISEAIGNIDYPALQKNGKTKQLLIEWEKADAPVRQPSEPPVITYVSYSQVETFEKCPLQYRYRYVAKIPTPSVPALSFGEIVHTVMNQFYLLHMEKKSPTIDDLLTLYEHSWSSSNYQHKKHEDDMRAHGETILRDYYEKTYNPSQRVLSLEQAFKIRINPHLTLGGKIDRVDQLPDGTIEIIDYKTGTAPKARNVQDDLQLSVYALAACDPSLYGYDPDKVTVSLYFFEGQEKISSKRTGDQLAIVRAKIADTGAHMNLSEFLPTPGKHCDYCEFRLICDAWK
jgi:DNA helicase-2/ATP-dependent DNA helicase PcrA